MTTSPSTLALIQYLTQLQPESVPEPVWLRIEDLFLDWLASALGSRGTHPVSIFESIAKQMGPWEGVGQILVNGERTSAFWAAWVNAASSHTLEQDDLHNGSVMHPATVIFPAVLAAAQDQSKSGQEMLLASIVGYEAGIRIAESLGRSHYRTFHTTATIGTLAAGLAVGKLFGFNQTEMINVMGSAGTQTGGLWEFMRSGAGDSKQLHCAHAASNGLMSAYMTRMGLQGAQDIIEGAQGLMKGFSKDDVNSTKLSNHLGTRWAVLETSFKFHACCRHTHPAADALLDAMDRYNLKPEQMKKCTARVHQAAIDVLGPVDALPTPGPKTIHAAKFSMRSTLALIAIRGSASLTDFKEHALQDSQVLAFRDKVEMRLDPIVDQAYPNRWLGRVDVELQDGTIVQGSCDEPKGDPGNTLSRAELEAKFTRLVSYSGVLKGAQIQSMIRWCWTLRQQKSCSVLE